MPRFYGTTLGIWVIAWGLSGWTSSAALLSFTDLQPMGGTAAILRAESNGEGSIAVASWTQTVAVSNATVSAIIADTIGGNSRPPAIAFLTRSLGPGTTPVDLGAPAVSFEARNDFGCCDQNSSPYQELFTGVDLSPDTYYLVIGGVPSLGGPFGDRYWWWGEEIASSTVHLSPGFLLRPFQRAYRYPSGGTDQIDLSFFPASEFNTPFDQNLFFKVEGSAEVPEPSTGPLVGIGAIVVGAVRFRGRRGNARRRIRSAWYRYKRAEPESAASGPGPSTCRCSPARICGQPR